MYNWIASMTVSLRQSRLSGLNGGQPIFGFGDHLAGFLHYGPKSVTEDLVIIGNVARYRFGRFVRSVLWFAERLRAAGRDGSYVNPYETKSLCARCEACTSCRTSRRAINDGRQRHRSVSYVI
jgi:hypothetical protein